MGEMERDDFQYDGTLLFNNIKRTDVKSEDPQATKDEILSKLPYYQEGSPLNNSRGFSKLDLVTLAESQEYILEKNLNELSNSVIDLKYVWEKYVNPKDREFVDQDGNETTAWIRDTDETYAYWLYPDYLFVQGSKGKVEKTEEKIEAAFGDLVECESIEFDPDFFLWLLYLHEYSDDTVPGPIEVLKLTSSEVRGNIDEFGHRGRIEDASNIGESLAIIAAILQEMDFHMVEGSFRIQGYSVTVEIKTTGRIHVKVAGAVEEAESKLKRALIALLFVSEFTKLYEEWCNMNRLDRYPPPTFLDQLAGTAAENNAKFNFDVDDLVEELENKRGEKTDPAAFAHL